MRKKDEICQKAPKEKSGAEHLSPAGFSAPSVDMNRGPAASWHGALRGACMFTEKVKVITLDSNPEPFTGLPKLR